MKYWSTDEQSKSIYCGQKTSQWRCHDHFCEWENQKENEEEEKDCMSLWKKCDHQEKTPDSAHQECTH